MIKHYVYFIRQGRKGSPIKIGVAKDVKDRMDNLQTASPFKLELLFCIPCQSQKAAYELERKFHKKFKKHRMMGEWFKGRIESMIHEHERSHESNFVDPEFLSHWYSI